MLQEDEVSCPTGARGGQHGQKQEKGGLGHGGVGRLQNGALDGFQALNCTSWDVGQCYSGLGGTMALYMDCFPAPSIAAEVKTRCTTTVPPMSWPPLHAIGCKVPHGGLQTRQSLDF